MLKLQTRRAPLTSLSTTKNLCSCFKFPSSVRFTKIVKHVLNNLKCSIRPQTLIPMESIPNSFTPAGLNYSPTCQDKISTPFPWWHSRLALSTFTISKSPHIDQNNIFIYYSLKLEYSMNIKTNDQTQQTNCIYTHIMIFSLILRKKEIIKIVSAVW